MKGKIGRYLVVACISWFSLVACSSKKDQEKIKKLEKQVEALNEEHATAISGLRADLQDKEKAFSEAQSKSREEIQKLTNECSQAVTEAANLKRMVEQAEAARLAAMPKDASTPGHPDFNIAKEPKVVDAVANISGDKVSGSGFVVVTDGKRYIYTAADVLAGNTRVAIANSAGRKFVKFGNLELADASGIVRLELLEADDAPALEPSAETTKAESGFNVTGLGLASDKVMVDGGSAFGQSADAIEADPAVLRGKNGGALVESANGKVLAVIVKPATEQGDLWTDLGVAAEMPLRALRINRTLSWKPVQVAAFLAESRKISEYNRFTRIAQALSSLNPSANGLGMDGNVSGPHSVLTVLTEAKSVPIVTEFLAFHEQLSSNKARAGNADLKKRYTNMMASAISQINRTGDGYDPTKFFPCNRTAAEKSLKWRQDAMALLEAKSKEADFATPREDPRKQLLDINPNGQLKTNGR